MNTLDSESLWFGYGIDANIEVGIIFSGPLQPCFNFKFVAI